jgi:hypothetical protein
VGKSVCKTELFRQRIVATSHVYVHSQQTQLPTVIALKSSLIKVKALRAHYKTASSKTKKKSKRGGGSGGGASKR